MKIQLDMSSLPDAIVGVIQGAYLAKRWENKAGKSGYSPVCTNLFKDGCYRRRDNPNKTRCIDCEQREFVKPGKTHWMQHIAGRHTFGLYPLFAGGTCHQLVLDFDKHHEADPDPWVAVKRFVDTCDVNDVPAYVLRSRSGKGFHVYLFFAGAVKAAKARAVAFGLLDESQVERGGGDGFDRLFPNQNKLAGNEIGNLFALPFQGQAMKNGHTMFFNPADGPDGKPYPDQIKFLQSIKRIDESKLDSIIADWDLKPDDPVVEIIDDDDGGGGGGDDYPQAYLDHILDGCAWLRHCRDDAASLPEPEWYSMLTIVGRCDGGDKICHDWSKSHPEYSTIQTAMKIQHSKDDSGPMLCKSINDLTGGKWCGSCQHWGKIVSPISLGSKSHPPAKQSVDWLSNTIASANMQKFLFTEPAPFDEVFVDSMLSGMVGILCGPGGSGKSTFVLQASIGVSLGKPFTGDILRPASPGKVLCIFGEETDQQIHHRVQAILNTVQLSQSERQVVANNMIAIGAHGHDIRLTSPTGRGDAEPTKLYETMLAELPKYDFRLIVLDSLSRIFMVNQNGNDSAAYEITLLERLAMKTGAAIIVIHHMSKRATFVNSKFNLDAAMDQGAARGASAYTDNVRWQANLCSIPKKSAKSLCKDSKARDGQYLAFKVCKKNHGTPDRQHFLERQMDGGFVEHEVAADVVDADVEELILDLLKQATLDGWDTGKPLTKRIAKINFTKAWKEQEPKISRAAVSRVVDTAIHNDEIYLVRQKNNSGVFTEYLSLEPGEDEENKADKYSQTESDSDTVLKRQRSDSVKATRSDRKQPDALQDTEFIEFV